jgi:hypothetical protein
MKPRYGVAIDQYGNVYHYGKHARRDLMEQIGRKRASKMYRDKKNGATFHVGYIIGPHWLTLYAPVELPA